MIKLIAADLDGTCLNSQLKVSEETKSVLTETIKRGVIFLPATGRTRGTIPNEIMEIPGVEYVLTSSGAVIQNIKTNEYLVKNDFPIESIKQVLEIIGDYDIFLEIYQNGHSYIDGSYLQRIQEFEPNKAYIKYFQNEVNLLSSKELRTMLDNEKIEKINVRLNLNDSQKRPDLLDRLRQIPDLLIVEQIEGNIEVTHKNADKGIALAEFARIMNIDPSEIMAIGDSGNDISMLEFAGIAVAMKQSGTPVKELADFITETNDRDGVARAIKKFFLNLLKLEKESG